ncbi:MAG: PAS domain S-box protein [Polyangiales bacterium]
MQTSMGRGFVREIADSIAAGRKEPAGLDAAVVGELARALHVTLGEVELQREELARQKSEIDRSRKRYRELFERAPVGYLLLDPEGIVEDANDAALALLARRRGDLLMHAFEWFVSPGHREAWAAAVAAVCDGQHRACELEVLRGDGASMAVHVEPAALARGDHEPRLLVTVTDNRQRVAAERALMASEANYRQLFNVNPVPMLIASREGQAVLAANPAAERAFQLGREEFRARALSGLAVEEDAAAIAAWLASPARGRDSRLLRFRRRNGDAMVAEASAHEVTFDGVDACLVVVEDITERWHAERETRRANELLRAVIAAAPMGIVCVGPNGDVVMCNEAVDRVLGAPCSTRVGRPFVSVCRAEGVASLLLQALEGAEVPATDLPYYPEVRDPAARSLRTRHLTFTAAPIRTDGRVDGAIVAITDVTRRRELEDQLRQADKLRAIGQLAGGIAHDFNNLLTVILSCATALRDHLPAEDPVSPDARDIVSATHRAASLTQRLLAFSRRQPGDTSEAAVDVVVRDWAESILRHWIRENIELKVSLDAREACVALDPTQLQQVLLNLVLNARDAIVDGGVIQLRTSLDVACEPARAVIEVIDNGVGMTPEVRERIFEPFFTTKGPDQGTGLGLATVYGIVQQADGEIEVDSIPGRGSRFCIALPCTDRVSRPTAPPPRLSAVPAGECVLLVEDDEAVRRSLYRGLTRLGFRVFEADGFERAAELARMYRDTVRVLVTDIVMPQANGFEVAREVRRLVPGVSVVYMSGYADEAIIPLGAAQEIGPILPKPFSPEDLAARIREVVGGSRSSAPPAAAPIVPLRVPKIS